MRSLVFTFVYAISSFVSQYAWAAKDLKASEIIIEAESSFMRGDLLNSNRFYGLAYEKTPQALEPKDIENLVVTKHTALPLKDFISYCKTEASSGKFKVETQFYCAKTLVHSENFIEAVDFVENIPKSYQRLEYHFLRASLFLKLNKNSTCLEEMDAAKNKVTENTSTHFKDLIQVIHARCLLSEGRYPEAMNKFQTLSVNSDFYLTTLEEQAWAHFKARNLTSARDILKILVSYFTGQDVKNQMFGADVYFRAKYLQAYIELISQNRDKAREMFAALKTEIQKFKKENFKIQIPKDTKVKLAQIKTYSQFLNKEYKFISSFRTFMSTWSAVEDQKNLDKELRYLVALNAEVERMKKIKNSNLYDYIDIIEKAQKAQLNLVYESMEAYLKLSRRNIDSIEFKANMGQVENFWAARTEGKRTLAEVLDAYKKEVTYVEEYLGK